MKWLPTIGVEVHVQLATRSKIFSGAATAFGAAPNTQACAVDLGLPGVLPVLNGEAVRMAVRFGLAIGAEINRRCVFDRKNYFYPDLPKGYQISQLDHPIIGAGKLEFTLPDGQARTVNITRAHLEEDAGKSIHDAVPGATAVDLNRAGTPLLEVVSEPEMHTPEEAAAYFRALWSLVRAIGICDGQLQEGSMRCDANVSVAPEGSGQLGERAEIKNVNSFRFVERAIRYEIERQIDVLESGGTIVRETRQYDDARDETRSMRAKELSDDYRYFPDPDLLPVELDEAFIESVRSEMPELPAARQARFERDLQLPSDRAAALAEDARLADYFEAAVAREADPGLTANWLLNDVAARLNNEEISISACPVSAADLAMLVRRLSDETLSSKTARQVFDALWAGSTGVDTIIEREGLKQMDDSDALSALVAEVVAANPDQVEQFRAGKEKVLGFFVGQIMKQTQGKANPKQVNQLLRDALST